DEGRPISRVDKDIAAEGHAGDGRPGGRQLQGRHDTGMCEGVVDETVSVRGQDVRDGLVALDAVLGEEATDLDVEALSHRGEVRLAVELDGVDAINVRPPVVGVELLVEDAPGQRETIVDARQTP